ncbi:MAG: hypothetical protein C5B49_10700 [Bdellovibrio sp.]|nr:MAG: hypothetical protein C5B49_10700 [Bdellovibrio sp.]
MGLRKQIILAIAAGVILVCFQNCQRPVSSEFNLTSGNGEGYPGQAPPSPPSTPDSTQLPATPSGSAPAPTPAAPTPGSNTGANPSVGTPAGSLVCAGEFGGKTQTAVIRVGASGALILTLSLTTSTGSGTISTEVATQSTGQSTDTSNAPVVYVGNPGENQFVRLDVNSDLSGTLDFSLNVPWAGSYAAEHLPVVEQIPVTCLGTIVSPAK